jgi:hypothetical protein
MPPDEKNVTDEFMLKEYESIAAAHFDSQDGLRQQFRFYLIIAAVPLTVVGLVTKEQATQVQQIGAWDLPRLVGVVFLGIGLLGILMLLSMIHTALDATLYARTVNGVRAYFYDRTKALGSDLAPYLKMPREVTKPKYFRVRAFFWQVSMISLINSGYIGFGVQTIFKRSLPICAMTFLLILQVLIYVVFGKVRTDKEVSG